MRWVVFLILGSVLVLAVYVSGVVPSFDSACDEAVLKEIESPNRKYVAAIVERACEAEGNRYVTRGVVLYELGDSYGGDIIAEASYLTQSSRSIGVVWNGETLLTITPHSSNTAYDKKETQWQSVRIVYVY